MFIKYYLVLSATVLIGLQAGSAVGQTAPAATGPAGIWKGPLPIPGGSLPIQIAVEALAPGRFTATLDLPAKRLSRLPMTATFHGDSLILFAAGPACRYACVLSADGQELRGRWSQPGLRVPVTLSRLVPVPVATAAPKASAVPVVSYHTETVNLVSTVGNTSLSGVLSIPDGMGPYPAAVLLSDMGAQDRDGRKGSYRMYADLASALARQGIAVLRLDDRGVGQSGGTAAGTTTAELVRDAQAALTFLRLRPTVDPVRTGLIGHGEGGNVALLAGAQALPPAFVATLAASGLVGQELLANQPEPATNPADTARAGAARRQAWSEVLQKASQLRASGSNAAQVETYIAQQRIKVKSEERRRAEATLKFRRTMLEIVSQTANDDQAQAIVVNMLRQRFPDIDPAVARTQAAQLTTPWSRYYLKFDPELTLAAVRCPVLLLHGTDDVEVNMTANLAALEKGLRGNKRTTARRLVGVNHWFQTPASELIAGPGGIVDPILAPVVIETVRDWVLQQTSK